MQSLAIVIRQSQVELLSAVQAPTEDASPPNPPYAFKSATRFSLSKTGCPFESHGRVRTRVISRLKKYAAEIGNLGHVCDSGWGAFLGTAVAETALNEGEFGVGMIVQNHRITL